MNRLSSLFLTIAALLAALAADAQHVDVAPRRIEVGFNKTVHILFPSPVTYIDIGSMETSSPERPQEPRTSCA